VLEKMRPIDHKLKHQIDKLVKTAATGSTGASDPTNFHAHPENMVSKEEESEESESEGEDNKSDNKQNKVKKGVYVPPKLAAVHYGK
jgi:U3 small nucleolar ribonucleoprotein protein LCP5